MLGWAHDIIPAFLAATWLKEQATASLRETIARDVTAMTHWTEPILLAAQLDTPCANRLAAVLLDIGGAWPDHVAAQVAAQAADGAQLEDASLKRIFDAALDQQKSRWLGYLADIGFRGPEPSFYSANLQALAPRYSAELMGRFCCARDTAALGSVVPHSTPVWLSDGPPIRVATFTARPLTFGRSTNQDCATVHRFSSPGGADTACLALQGCDFVDKRCGGQIGSSYWIRFQCYRARPPYQAPTSP